MLGFGGVSNSIAYVSKWAALSKPNPNAKAEGLHGTHTHGSLQHVVSSSPRMENTAAPQDVRCPVCVCVCVRPLC